MAIIFFFPNHISIKIFALKSVRLKKIAFVKNVRKSIDSLDTVKPLLARSGVALQANSSKPDLSATIKFIDD